MKCRALGRVLLHESGAERVYSFRLTFHRRDRNQEASVPNRSARANSAKCGEIANENEGKNGMKRGERQKGVQKLQRK